MTNIKDVAKRAGVSVSTVSHALSGKRPVSQETRARILEAIETLGYQPSTYAQSLVTGRTRTIGILFPLEGSDNDSADLNTIQFEMIMAANSIVQANGYGLHVFTQTEDETALRGWCRQCDGLLIASVRLNDKRIDYLMRENYPFVVLGRPTQEQADQVVWVDTNFEDMMMQLMTHLVELKHREIVFLDKPERLFKEQLGYEVRARQGYLQACEKFGLEPLIYGCEVTIDDGYQTMHTILEEHPNLTALAAFNDAGAVGAYYALREHGLNLPNDFSIITFSSPGFLRSTVPTITAMSNPGAVVSSTAAELLLAMLQETELDEKHILIRSELLPNGYTTAPVLGAN